MCGKKKKKRRERERERENRYYCASMRDESPFSIGVGQYGKV